MTDHQGASRLSETAASVRDDAATLGSKAADKLASAADSRKSTVTEPMRQVSDAIEAAADQLSGANTPAWLGSGLRSVAETVSDFAQQVEGSDSKQLLSQVQNFAREKPTIFLAGCAALGFAAARVLRAGAPESMSGDSGEPSFGGEAYSTTGASFAEVPMESTEAFRSPGDVNDQSSAASGAFADGSALGGGSAGRTGAGIGGATGTGSQL